MAGGATLNLSGTLTNPSYTMIGGTGSSVANINLTGTLSGGTRGGTGVGLVIGTTTTPTVFTINGGNLAADGKWVNFFDPPGLVFGQADGSVTALKLISGTITTNTGEFWLGDRTTNSAYAAFTQLGGTVTTASYFVVGNSYDRGVFNISGGSFTTLRDAITIGAGNPYGNAMGVVNISGGVVTSPDVWVGEIGTGVINMSHDGLLNVFNLQFGGILGPAFHFGIFNLGGGTLTLSRVSYGGSNSEGIFNFHGGLLRASPGGFFQSPVSVYSYPESAFIDDGGNSFTMVPAILAPSGNGVSSIAVTGGAGYLDTPIVQITNAAGDTTGKGATAVANLDVNGNLTSISVTNPGVGYTLSPTVSLLGGGGSGAAIGTVTLSPNSSGGLTKTGFGTLTLSRNNTYTGPTNVMTGTLWIAGTLSGGGPVNVKGGARLAGTGIVAGPVLLAAGTSNSSQGAINLANNLPGTLTLNGGLIGGGASGEASRLVFDVGFTTNTTDRLNLGAAGFTANAGGVLIVLNTLGASLPGDNYTLMTFSTPQVISNVSLASNRLGLNTVTLNVSANSIGVSIAGQPVPATAYWTGTYGSSWTSIGGVNGDLGNFNTNATGGINTLQLPYATTDVFFTANGASNLNTTLDQNFYVKSLTVKAGTGPVSIIGPQLFLAIQSGQITVEGGASGLTIGADLLLLSNQTWSNSASAPLIIGGTIIGGNRDITVAGTVWLSGNSNITGGLTIAGGTLQLGTGGASGALNDTSPTSITIVDNGVLAFNRSDTYAFENPVRGPGSVVQLGSGTLIIGRSDNFSYKGGTVVSSGTLLIPNPTNIHGSITNNSHLWLGGSRDGASMDISGNGDVLFVPDSSGAATLTMTGAQAYTGSTTLKAKDYNFNTRLVLSGTKSHSIGLVTTKIDIAGGTTALQVAGNATLTSDGITSTSWIIDGTHIIRTNGSPTGTSKVNLLSIAHSGSGTNATYTGILNLNDNKLIVQSTGASDKATKIGDLNAAITAGSNGATWTGNGITSGTAAQDANHYGVGLFDNAILQKTSFGGQPTDTNSILISIAHLGDVNDDGIVNTQDSSIVANNWQQSRNNWAQGDLNRDGIVNIQDFAIVANNWQQTSIYSLEPSPLSPQSSALSPSSVPEPASLALFAAGFLLLTYRLPRCRIKVSAPAFRPPAHPLRATRA